MRKRLTVGLRRRVWEEIRKLWQPDDRSPSEVIAQDYNGDEDAYLLRMAQYFGFVC